MKTRPTSFAQSSFTLVEMLTAMVVLFLLILMIFSIVGSALKVSDSTGRSADSDIEARQVLDTIGNDIAGMVNRSDVDQLYYKATGNDKMFFYTQQTGFLDPSVASTYQSPITLVGYRINTTDNSAGVPTLERLAQGLVVNASADSTSAGTIDPNTTTGPLTFLTFPARTAVSQPVIQTLVADPQSTISGQTGTPIATAVGTLGNNYDNGTSPFYDSIGNQIFRMEICFQLQNGSYSLTPGFTNSAPVYPASITNTVAIVVAIATLDTKSREIVPATSWAKMIAALPDPTTQNMTNNILMDSLWNSALNQSSFASTAGIPATAASHIRVYQRYYFLNTPKAQ